MEASRRFMALSRNQRMAVKLRRNEKRILLRTIAACENAMEGKATGDRASAGFPRGAAPVFGS